eukprot:3961214-Amphidinium_carterae.1
MMTMMTGSDTLTAHEVCLWQALCGTHQNSRNMHPHSTPSETTGDKSLSRQRTPKNPDSSTFWEGYGRERVQYFLRSHTMPRSKFSRGPSTCYHKTSFSASFSMLMWPSSIACRETSSSVSLIQQKVPTTTATISLLKILVPIDVRKGVELEVSMTTWVESISSYEVPLESRMRLIVPDPCHEVYLQVMGRNSAQQ